MVRIIRKFTTGDVGIFRILKLLFKGLTASTFCGNIYNEKGKERTGAMKKFIGNLILGILIIIGLWIIGSYIDIVLHNLDKPLYSNLNFFNLLLKRY